MERPLAHPKTSGSLGPPSSTAKINSSHTNNNNNSSHPKNNKNSSHKWSGIKNDLSSLSMIENYKNFKKSSSPARLMKWSDKAWVELPEDALSVAKSAFLEQRPMVEVKLDGNDFIFDFYRMLLIDVGNSASQKSIAWIDDKGGCYFPSFFVDDSLNDRDDDDDDIKIEIDIKVNKDSGTGTGTGTGKRKVRVEADKEKEKENEDTADSSSNNGGGGGGVNAKRQRVVAGPVGGNLGTTVKWPNAKLLGEGERAFAMVTDLFMSEMGRVDPSVRITGIHQFTRTGPLEKARWEAFHCQMEMIEAERGRSNTVFAWHGTSKKGVFDILAHGFGLPSKVQGSYARGVGVYFSPARLPNLSDMLSEIDEDGEKHLVLCRVIMGKMERVEVGSEQFHPSSHEFDSGVDELVNPRCYIVWCNNMNTHILPECVVSYKSSNAQNGKTMGGELLQWIPNGTSSIVAKLFSKLGSLLPAPKVEELKALCMTYKGGKLAKDLFIKQLKIVVGNEILQSAISDVQGSN